MVSGPKKLNVVAIPSSRLGPAACRREEWKTGAKQNVMPASTATSPTRAGGRSRAMPSASSTSADPDDDEAASDFRRFTESGLRDGKAAASGTVIDTLEDAGLPPELDEEGLVIDVELTRAEAETWMRAFTDIRLALATRLEVEAGDEDYWHSLPDDDPRAQAHDIYEWVGFLQETVIEALTA